MIFGRRSDASAEVMVYIPGSARKRLRSFKTWEFSWRCILQHTLCSALVRLTVAVLANLHAKYCSQRVLDRCCIPPRLAAASLKLTHRARALAAIRARPVPRISSSASRVTVVGCFSWLSVFVFRRGGSQGTDNTARRRGILQPKLCFEFFQGRGVLLFADFSDVHQLPLNRWKFLDSLKFH